MRCEGDNTYEKPGDCPVCGMHLKKEEAKPVSGSKENTYTCPMHPEVAQDHPGSCPKCGMDLVPEKREGTNEVGIALITFAVWGIWGPEPAYVYAFVNAIAVLIIACPCA